MRFQKITNYYPTSLEDFYSRRRSLAAEPYSIQLAALMEDARGWSNFWSLALTKLGYETNEVVSNAEPMQKAWARENGVRYHRDNWLFDITTAQIKAFQPEILFVNDYVTYGAAYLKELRSTCPSIRLIIGWCGAPYKDHSVFNEYDIVLSSAPELVQDFTSQGHRSSHINHAFHPRVLEKLTSDGLPSTPFSFIGSIAKRERYHLERETLLLELIKRTPLQLWMDVGGVSLRQRSELRSRQHAYDLVHWLRRSGFSWALQNNLAQSVLSWKERPEMYSRVDSRLVKLAQAPLFGLSMFSLIHRSRVSLNTHIDLSSNYASNMRLYEVTGVGSCLLTDWKPNLHELFEPDVELVAYRTADECVEKVTYLLENEETRNAIAAAGQRRTLRDHTFDQRAQQLDRLIRQALA